MHPAFNQQSTKGINKYFYCNVFSKTSWAAGAEPSSECHQPRSKLLINTGGLSTSLLERGVRDRDRTGKYILCFVSLKNRNRTTGITACYNRSSGRPPAPQEPRVGTSALDISNPWIWPHPRPRFGRNHQSNAYLT